MDAKNVSPTLPKKYNKTKQREDILNNEGYTVDVMWECDWKELKSNL